MKRVAIAAVLLLGVSALIGTAALAQDTPSPATESTMQMYHIVMMDHGPNWKSQGQRGGMEARMEAIEGIKAAAKEDLIISAGLVNDETDVEFILILDVQSKTEAKVLMESAKLVKSGFYKPVIYSYFAPKGLKLKRK